MNPSARPGKSLRTKRPILGLIFLFVGFVLLLCNWKWILSALQGPVQMSTQQIGNQIEDPSDLPNPWISFLCAKQVETGLGLLEEGSRRPISRYLLVPVNQCWLVVEVPYAYRGTRFTGCLETWSVPLRTKSLAGIRSRFPHCVLLNYQMDACYAYREQCWALLGIIGVLMLVALYLMLIGFASPTKLRAKGSTDRPTPAWLPGPSEEVPADKPILDSVFEARQINALTADRLYRVYAEDGRIYLIRIGGQQLNAMFAVHFGLLGGLIAALLSRGNKSQDEIAKLDAQRPSELLANHKHNFSFTISDVLEATLDPPSIMAQHGPHVGRWTFVLKDGKKTTFQFEKIEDMQKAERILTTALGPMMHVNVTWDTEKECYRKQ